MLGLYADSPRSASCFHRLRHDEVWHVYGGDPFMLTLLHPDGRIVPVKIRASHGELDGRPTIFAVFTDQSARRAAEVDAARQLARLTATLSVHPDVVLVLDATGRIVESLRRGSAAMLPTGDGQSLGDGLPAFDAARLQVALQAVIAGGMPITLELSLSEGDATRCEELRLVPLPDRLVLALIRDITEARRAERALRDSESEFRQLFDTLPQGVVYQAADGQIVRANPAACRLLGMTMGQLLGRDSMDPTWRAIREDGSLFPGSEHPAMVALITGQPVEGVVMGVYRPDRSDHVWLLVSAMPEFRPGEQRPWRVFASFADITAQRRSSQSLVQSQELFEQAGRLAQIGTWELDVDTGRSLWSRVTREIHEVDQAFDPSLVNAFDFYVDGDSRDRIRRAVDRVVRTGEIYDEELEIVTARGRRRWVRTIGRAVFEQGRCVRLYGTFQDITDRQQVLLELTRQSELQQMLMDIAATYINLPLEQLDEAIGRSLSQLGAFSGADRFYVFSYDFERMVTSNTHEWCAPGIEPQRTLLQDFPLVGMDAWVETHQRGWPIQIDDVQALSPTDPVRIALERQGIRSMVALPLMQDGLCLGFVGMDQVRAPHPVGEIELKLLAVFAQMLVNVSIRQSMLRELTENRNFLAEVIENSGSLIYIKDLDGHYLSVNQRWEAVYGLQREAVVGRADEELFPVTLATTLQASEQGVIRTGRLREGEEQFDTPSGRRHFYTVRFPVRDRDGHIYGIAAMANDITERQRLEEERQARALAETASREKSAFLARMSHEIRTPLNAIIGFSRRLMDDDGLTLKSAEQVRTVHRSATHLLSMINDLLDYSRMEIGRTPLLEQDFDLRALLEDLSAMFRFRCEEKHLKFLFLWDPELPRRTRGDAGKLRQILMNLLGNAVKFTSSGHVTLRARRAIGHAEGFRVEFEVEDSGIGIPADELPRLFDEFWQGRSGQAMGGTGLGLPIAQSLLKLLGGGALQVDSQPGRGSCFRFLLPLGRASGSEGAEASDGADVMVEARAASPNLPGDAEIGRLLAELLPAGSLQELREALGRGEMSVFRELVAGAAGLSSAVTELLLGLAAQYDYSRLERLLGTTDGIGGGGHGR